MRTTALVVLSLLAATFTLPAASAAAECPPGPIQLVLCTVQNVQDEVRRDTYVACRAGASVIMAVIVIVTGEEDPSWIDMDCEEP